MNLITLFVQFMKYGLLCFGGGYMIIPLLYTDFVQKTPVFTPESYGNLLSLSQITPGPVSINTATYVGFIQEGFWGAVISSVGLCVPTFVLCLFLLSALSEYKDKALVVSFFKGVRWAAFLMIFSAVMLFAEISILDVSEGIKNIQVNWTEICVMFGVLMLAKKVPFTLLLILSAFVGWGVSFL